ncbi:MAG: hypothetical protein MI702_11910, partial [Chlorobiales bacterium]|nr:hypothetical protein [Chlorobiales bacterium]
MSFSFLRIAIAAFLMVLMALGVPCFGDDYLVIKKKGGNEKRVPLGFDPTQIESFRLETTPGSKDAGKKDRPSGEDESAPPPAREFEEPPSGRSEPKPMEISPRTPSEQPSVQDRQPAEERVPAVGETKRRRSLGPVSAQPIAVGKGAPFTANIYELPDHVKALPDYSAMRPAKTVSADKINLYPEKGLREPAGVPDDAQGMGMRFQGVFLVAGEGIFRW